VIVAGESKKKQEEKKREWKINGEIVRKWIVINTWE